jgi:DNA replication protein DnaC
MKFYETHFEEYIISNQKEDLHPKTSKIYSNFPKTLGNLKNLIFYGPSGIGKYTQMLCSIKKYSPTEFKY